VVYCKSEALSVESHLIILPEIKPLILKKFIDMGANTKAKKNKTVLIMSQILVDLRA